MRAIYFLILSCCLHLHFSIHAQPVTYQKNIRPLLNTNCVSCHSREGIGPMPLTNFKEVSAYAKMIESVTSSHRMPPWKADPGFSSIKNIPALKNSEIELIKKWIADGFPEGDRNTGIIQQDPVTSFTGDSLHFGMTARYILPRDHTDYAQVFVIPTFLDSAVYIDAIKFLPGNRKVVKSCSVSIDSSGRADELDKKDPKPGYSNFGGYAFIPQMFMWYQWTAGEPLYILPPGFIKRIPAGSKLLFYMTYMQPPDGIVRSDSSSIIFHRVDNITGKKEIISKVLINEPFEIKAYDQRQMLVNIELTATSTIHSIMPLGQFVCRSWELTWIDQKSGRESPLLYIPDWDYNWRKKYDLIEPLTLRAGSIIRARAMYDNTEKNGNLPLLPPVKTIQGEARRQEMFMVAFDVSY